ncbi:histidine kinase [Mucilaginibacter sp. CSA2-8R]|uniref:sensor histidine kinase n=1 Tax=Mucilaginibacter sp. CSA2-8R TaxID=3141542 RepID=UPI00315DCA6F
MALTDIIIPLTIILFAIAFGVVLLYQNFQRSLVKLELEKIAMEAKQQNELLQNSIMVEEQERKRIARDLHDDLGATISIINMNLKLIRQQQWLNENQSQYFLSIDNIIDLSTRAIDTIRSISHQLMPTQLELFGLMKTVVALIKDINQSGKIKAELIINHEWPDVKWEVALGAYRIIMELINNTIKHANASHILLSFARDKQSLLIHFEDDGIGFQNDEENKAGLGLTNMEARAQGMHGHFTYGNGAEKGIKAIVSIPVDLAIKPQTDSNV